MRKVTSAVLAMAAALAATTSAVAAVVIGAANSGYSFSVDYTGFVAEAWTNQVSALADFTFDGVTNGGRTYNFSYSLTNDSQVSSRIRSFGFDTAGDISGASATGAYSYIQQDGQFPVGLGRLDLCFVATGNGNCTGGPGGLQSGQTGAGSFAITFAEVMDAVTFDNFAVRFQSIDPQVNGSSSGIGIGALVDGGSTDPITAPEPGTWLMMLGGFGLVGGAMRRRARSGAALAG